MTAMMRRDFSGACAEGFFTHGVSPRRGRLASLLSDALELGRASDVEREMVHVLAQSGGRLTDSVEREMMNRLLQSDWSSRR